MKHKNLLYKIEIREIESKKTYLMEIRTPHLNWSMEQYQRNRPALVWKLIEEKE